MALASAEDSQSFTLSDISEKREDSEIQFEQIFQEEESSFSNCGCDSCGSSLAGEMHTAHGFSEDGNIFCLSVCVDCVMFHASGDLPETWE